MKTFEATYQQPLNCVYVVLPDCLCRPDNILETVTVFSHVATAKLLDLYLQHTLINSTSSCTSKLSVFWLPVVDRMSLWKYFSSLFQMEATINFSPIYRLFAFMSLNISKPHLSPFDSLALSWLYANSSGDGVRLLSISIFTYRIVSNGLASLCLVKF